MADTTLTFIQNTARRITKKITEAALTTDQLNQYINYFLLYKMPEHLKLKDLREVFTFYTQPGVDTYQTITDPGKATDPFYQFKQRYTNIYQPIYFAGVPGALFTNRESFYAYWPETNLITNLNLSADGINTIFSGTATPVSMLQGSVSFTAVDALGNSIILVDYPQNESPVTAVTPTPIIGALGPVNQPQLLSNPITDSPFGYVNYITGEYLLEFPTPPAALAPIYLDNFPYTPGIPTSMLFFDNIFTLRPVPDRIYTCQFTVDRLPTELLASDQSPDIFQWAEYIALGASLLIFRDSMDMNSMSLLQPEFDKVEMLVQRPTICEAVQAATFSYYKQRRRSYGWWPFGTWPY